MTLTIPQFANKSDLFAWLVANKSELITQKKAALKHSEPTHHGTLSPEKGFAVKAVGEGVEIEAGALIVDVVANLAMWSDSYDDVMITDNWNKSIKDKGTKIPFLKDHEWSISNKIAKTLEVYTMEMDLKKMGIKSDVKTAQALIFKGELRRSIDPKMYELYKNDMVDQHSIGMRYLQIDLAINDPDEKDEYKVWQKYYAGIINKDYVEKKGYFWAVKEAIIYENSAVLFGANSMTPTLSVEEKSLDNDEPPHSTQDEEPNNNKEQQILNAIYKTYKK